MAKRTAIEAAKEHSFAALKAAANRLRAVQRTEFDVLPISERTYIERVLEFASWDGADAKRFMQLSVKLQIGCAVIGITGEQQDLKLTRALQATVASTGLSL